MSNYIDQLESNRNLLFKVASKFYTCNQDKEDLVQDTLLMACKNIHMYNPKYALGTWLVKIMKNRYLTTIKNKSCKKNYSYQYEELTPLVIEYKGPSEEMEFEINDLTSKKLENALESLLNPKEKLYIKELYLEGYSSEELSKYHKVSVSNILMLRKKGLDKLKNAKELIL